ncbi:MAG: GntR family transcriptional regulator [Clostridiales bacterium]|jgi:DNA-binding GntR family transcriptional regulator|nr:GntR family transcriptional regulator [Clostridiales bacterium]
MLIKQSLSEQIYQYLKKDIILQKIPCGSKLTIKELELNFNVSSTPVREALTRLAQEGLIDFSANVGARVCDFTIDDLVEITDICEIFDCYAIEKAMGSEQFGGLLNELEGALINHEKIIEDNTEEIGEWYYSNDFHTAFYNYIGNARVKKNAESYRAQFSMVVAKSSYFETLRDTLFEHKLIYGAVKEKNIGKAIFYLKQHFENGRKRILKMK